MGKIGDLFVRLGLKKDGFSKGMNEAKKETRSFGKTLGDMKAGALAVWAVVGSAVMKFADDFKNATNVMSDKWAVDMAKMKSYYNTFLYELTETLKTKFGKTAWKTGSLGVIAVAWKSLWDTLKNGKEAADAAGEMTKAFDAEFELTQSVRLQRLQVQQELNELMMQMRDTTLSNIDRNAAADRYRALLEPIAKAEVQVYGKMLNEAIRAWQAGNDLDRVYSTEEIVEFFSKIGTEYDKMAAKFPDLMRVYETRKGDATNLPIFDIIAKYQQAANQMSDVDKSLSRILNGIRAKTVQELKAIANEVAKYVIDEDLKLDLEVDLELDTEELDFSELDQEIMDFANSWNEHCLAIKQMNDMLEDSLISSFSNGMQALTDFMMGVEGADAKQVLAAFIQPLADTMRQMGEMFIAEGIAMKAFKNSITNPTAMIAAGAALIAVSSIVSSGLNKLTGNAGGGTAATTSSQGTSSSGSIETYEQEITVHVVGEISGNNIVLAGQKTLNKWSR